MKLKIQIRKTVKKREQMRSLNSELLSSAAILSFFFISFCICFCFCFCFDLSISTLLFIPALFVLPLLREAPEPDLSIVLVDSEEQETDEVSVSQKVCLQKEILAVHFHHFQVPCAE